ncbi:MAG TPA: ABC transporter substrate-binding protein [Beijerinckiaceae bacterium]|nr:ABC transporter substrate-binding protein [Beijerinckiaceae bacterium]
MIARRNVLKLIGAGLACMGSESAYADSRLELAVSDPASLSHAAVYYAKAVGYFQREGLDVDIRPSKTGALAARMIASSGADIAQMHGVNYLRARAASGADLVSIATMAQTAPYFMVLAAGGSDTPEALKGKKIGLGKLGGAREAALEMMLQNAGVPPTSITPVKVEGGLAGYGLILAKQIDALVADLPSTTQIRSTEADAVIYPIYSGVPGSVFVASPSRIRVDRESYVGFLRAVRRAAEDILAAPDPHAILKSIAFVADLPKSTSVESSILELEGYAKTWLANGRVNLLRNVPAQWAQATQTMSQLGLAPKSIDPGALYTNALVDQAAHPEP